MAKIDWKEVLMLTSGFGGAVLTGLWKDHEKKKQQAKRDAEYEKKAEAVFDRMFDARTSKTTEE